MARRIFITGGTGYIGMRLIPRLVARGLEVCAVVRPGSEKKIPAGCRLVQGDALASNTYLEHIAPGDTFVHLVGVAHPSPSKTVEFETIDYTSAVQAIAAAQERKVAHFVYLSVAHPAPVMQAYWSTRARCEELLRATGMRATVLRPWYVLGPGHWWPLMLVPFYAAAERIPSTRETAKRLGLVTIGQMTRALERAVTEPGADWQVWSVEDIRRGCTPSPRIKNAIK
ncbi:MAG: SDR family oxidoreductase [Bryobacteraceae bacterium]